VSRDEAIQRFNAIEPMLRAKGIVQAWLFGSVARDAATEVSDVDVAIRTNDPDALDLIRLASIRADLMDALEIAVDVVVRDDIADNPAFDMAFRRDAVQVL
jgi:hypothetical protein